MPRTLICFSLGLLLCSAVLAAGGPNAGPFPTPAVTGSPYTFNFSPSGGTPPYSYSLLTGTPPPGITLGSNALTGTPTVSGFYPLAFQVTDSNTLTATVSGVLVVSTIATYTDRTAWQSASTSGTLYNLSLPGSPGGGTQYPSNTVSVPPVYFGANTLFDCGGTYPACGASSGTGWLRAGTDDSIVAVFPGNQNVISAGADFAAAGANSPTTIEVVATTLSGQYVYLTVDPGSGTTFVGFVSTNPSDPIISIGMTPENTLNSGAMTDLSYYAPPAASTLLTSSLISPSAFGKPLTLTATVSPGSATGAVTFYNGAAILGTRQLSGGQAQLATSLLPAGTNKLRAYYSGDANNGPGTSNLLPQTVSSKIQNGFQTPAVYSTGGGSTSAYSVAAGDFNGDNIPDLAVTNFVGDSGVVAVLLGNSNGTFGSPTPYSVGNGARAVAVGDFNGDGKSDLAVASLTGNSVSILLGIGDGTFQPAVPYSIGSSASGPAAIVIADFDGDGKADVATINQGSRNISVFPGTGTGALGSPTFVPCSAIPTSGTIGDFNGDGLADLAVTDQASNIEVFISTGGGSFAQSTWSAGSGAVSPVKIAVADLNGDGYPDLVTTNSGSNNVSVLLGAANGTFGSAAVINLVNGSAPGGLAIGDFTGDGNLDIAVGSTGGGFVQILNGDGQGNFVIGAAKTISGAPTDLAAADFNGDGISDLVAANSSDESVSVLLGLTTVWGGQPVTISWQDPEPGQYYAGPLTATVGSGVEFPSFFGNNPAFNVDFTDDTVVMSSNETRGNIFDTGSPFNGLVVEPGAGSAIPPFTSVSLINSSWPDVNANPFERWRLSFDSNHIYADFSGEVNQQGDSVTIKVNQTLTPTSTTLISNGSPSILGQPVSFTAAVPAGATGVVSFFSNAVGAGNFLGDAAISAATATFTTSTLPTGSTALIAYYNGDSNFDASTSNPVGQLVQQTSSTTITSTKNPAPLGYLVTFRLHSVAGGSGTLTVTDGANVIGTAQPNSDGFANVQTSALAAGVHTITATYSGDPNYADSSNSLQQTILPGTTISLSTPGGLLGRQIPLTATVSPSGADGRVIFYDGATMLGSAVLSGGTAVLNTPLLPSGVRYLHAIYPGSASWSPSVSAQISTTVTMNPQSGFLAPVNQATGPATVSSVVGDFNGDGIQDVAVLDILIGAQTPPFGQVTILLGAGDGTFPANSVHTYTLGNDVHQILSADFNQDGIPDLLVADGASGVIVLTGAGDGTFTVGAENSLFQAVTFNSAALGDFNSDGIPDLIGGDQNQVALFLGDGLGGFSYDVQIAPGPANSVAVADVNRDGNPDVLWISNAGLQLMEGKGDTTFGAQQSYSPTEGITSLAVGDFTGDNLPDVVIGTSTPNVFVLPNAGNGTFGPPVTITPGGTPSLVAAGDFNADGKQDIIAVDPLGETFYLISSLGGGNFDTPVSLFASLTPAAISTGSFARDGRLSLAAPNGVTDDVAIFLAQLPPITVNCPFTAPVVQSVAYSTTCSATGGVAPFGWSNTGSLPDGLSLNPTTRIISGTPTGTGPFSFSITASDSDNPVRSGSANFNIVVATPLQLPSTLPNATLNTPYSLSLISGGTPAYTCSLAAGALPSGINLDPEFCQLTGVPSSTGPSTFTILAADSGTPPQSTSQAYLLTVDPAATFTTLTSNINPSSFGQPIHLTATVAPGGTGTVNFFDGTTSIGSAPLINSTAALTVPGLTSGTHSLTAQFTGDASNAPSTSSPVSQTVLPATTTTLSVSPASPLFGQPVTLTASVAGGSPTGKVTFYDGTNPLGTSTLSGGEATLTTVLLGPGTRSLTAYYAGSPSLSFSTSTAVSKAMGVRLGASFSVPTDYTIGPNVRSVAVGDFNGDGIEDLAAATYGGQTNSIAVLLGNGNGTFQNAVTYSTGAPPHAVAVGDFNGDGIQDLVALTPDANSVALLIGNGDGTFGSAASFSAAAADTLAIADFNKDGNPDIALGSMNNVYILPGNGNGTFGQAYFVQGTSGYTAVTAADFDGDGNPDVASVDNLGAVRVMPGNGDGTFQSPFQQSIETNGITLAAADFNHDGHPDLIVGADGVGVRVLLTAPNGAPGSPVIYTAGNVPGFVTVGDFDGDGNLDIAAADFSSSNFHTLAGVGDGTFRAAVAHPTSSAPFALAVGNFFGGTGRSDVFAGYASQDASVLLEVAPSMTLNCTPATAPPVLTGVSYTINCGAAGGIAPLTFGATGLPPGLAINNATGVISGIPSAAGPYTINAQVVDSDNPQGGASTRISVSVVSPLAAAASPLPGGLLGVSYSTSVFGGGTPPYTCGLSSGSYPPGLTMNGSTCVLSGVPTTPGIYSFTVGNSDSGSPQQNLTQPFSLTVQQTTTTTLTPDSNPATAGQNLTLTAAVSPAGATGTVTFNDGAGAIGTGTLNGSGIATLTLNSLSAGSHSLTAVYPGDTANTASASTVLTELVKNTVVVNLSSSANPAPTGQNVTFTAKLFPSTAAGTVTFKDGTGTIGSGTLSNGTATFTISTLAVGSHIITADYPGDADDFPSTSSTLGQLIKTATTISLTSSPTPTAGLGAPVTLTAIVSPASNGQVTFYNNGVTVLGTSPLSNGVATLTTKLLPAGPNKFTAFYPGDSVTLSSASSGVPEAIVSAPQGGFDTGVPYPAGTGPWGSAVGDFNNDGHPDVVVADYNASTISVLLGTPVGTLSQGSTITLGASPFAVAVGDFNGDGNSDLAVANLFGDSISVLLGNGNGTFAQPVTYTQGIQSHPSILVAADFDGDGFTDLATANFESASVSVLRGLGDGTFAAGQTYTVGANPAGLVAGDFNNDGYIDLATANKDNSDISVLLNNGDGTFGPLASYPTGGSGPQYLAAYDLNGDGALDLISANQDSNNISVLNGTGTGAFGAPALQATGTAPFWISTGDFNGDGNVDLAVSNDGDSSVTVFVSDGLGGLTSAGPYSSGITGGGARGSVVADLNGDGISDLVLSAFNANEVSVMLGLAQTITTLKSSINPTTYGETTTLNVTVSPSSAGGSVTFFDGTTNLGSTGLSGGTTSLDVSSLTAGVHSLTARYNGDIFDARSTSAAVSQIVQQVATTTTLTSSSNPSQGGQSVALTASVIPLSGGTFPSGFVTFLDGSTSLGSVALDADAHAVLNISTLTTGPHTLTASYLGDSNDTASASSPLTQTVQTPATTTSITSSLNPSTLGAAVTFTVTVTPLSATGTVNFSDGSTSLGTRTLSGGTASLTVSTLSVASHTIIASYSGDANDGASVSSPLSQIVKTATTVSLTSSTNTPLPSQPFTLTAGVAPASATGSITFRDGSTTLGSGTLANGIATLLVTSLSSGPHTLTAIYGGDANDAPGQGSLTLTVTASPPVISTSGLPAGQVGASYGPVTMQATGGSGTYSWSAAGLPAGLGMDSGGTLSGTPSAAFDGSVTVTVTDSLTTQSTSGTFNLSITAPALSVSGPSSLGITTVGGTLSGSFTAQGGAPPYTWSLSGAAGFSIDQNGKVTGAPTQPGDSSITVQVKDSSPKPLTALAGATFSAFGLTTGSLPAASTLADYSASLSAAGGTPPYTFTASGLPANLGVSGAAITGRALSPGTFPIALKASDSKGLTASASLTLTVTGPGPLQVLSVSLSDGTTSQPYSGTLSAQGGSPAYTWALSGGVLPPGLSLDSGGNVFGTPTLTGSFSFGVQVTDTAGGKVVGTISLNVAPAPLQITNGSGLPSGIAGSQYPSQILNAAGGVAPYTFGAKGSLPDGMSLTSDGQLSGTPTTAGDYTFGVTVTDSAAPANSSTLSLSMSVRPNSADLVLSAGSLSFSLTAGTSAVPADTSVTVTSSQAGQVLDFTTAVSGASWLSVSSGGSTPSPISVGLAASALNLTTAGSPYSGTVVVSCTSGPCAGKSQSIDVTLTVTSPPPQLSVTSPIFSFVASAANPQASSAALGIQNSGGDKLTVNSVSAADSWLSVSAFSGDVLPGPGAALTVTADPGSLPAGYYTSTILVKTSAGNASIPVTLLISSQATMALGPDGAQFSMPAGGAPGNPAGSFLVSVSSTAPVNYSAIVLPGASWLVGGGAGSASSASPGVVSFSIDPTAAAALPVGAYYGTIRVNGSGIVNTPQDFQVVLSVSPAAAPVVPDPEPGGLLFLSATPGAQPPQLISVYASSKTPLTFQASATGGKWLTVSSTGGSASAGSPAQLNALVDSTGLNPGVYSGAINFASGPAIRSVTVTLVVETPVSAGPSLVAAASGLKAADTPACPNAKLAPAPTALATNFSAPAAWPTPITIQLVDTCGSVIGRGQIVATFSNGDPPLALTLVNASTGVYSGTWTPRRTASQTVINAQASASGYSPAVVQLAGQVTPNAAPQLTPNGTLDVFHPQVGAGLGPGNIVQIYGTSLSSQPASANTLPLPTKVGGTQVLIGGVQAPLFYVSPTQVNAQIPFELTAGQQYQVIVNANGALTTPQPIQLTAAVPAVLQFTSGLVIAQHGDGTLVSDTAPAAPGEFIVLYMTGLGATDIPVPTGQASPADPPARVLDTPVLTLDDITVPTSFAGLTPGLVGLYQINLQIPADLPDKTYDLKVTQSGTVSNSTSLPVKTPATN